MTVPFRWNIARGEQLGRLVRGPAAKTYPGFPDDLRTCCARVVALADDSRLVFVGRSPESLFDYLSGVLAPTSWDDRLALLNISLKGYGSGTVDPLSPKTAPALKHLEALGLAPSTIASSGAPVTFVDLVYRGETFGHLAGMILGWAEASGVDLRAVRRRMRFVGVTERTKNSPNTWRWQQQLDWTREFRPTTLRSVSAPYRFWTFLGNAQDKVTDSHPPTRWALEEALLPPRSEKRLAALRLALELYERGNDGAERAVFASALAGLPEMRHAWLRDLVTELRSAPAR